MKNIRSKAQNRKYSVNALGGDDGGVCGGEMAVEGVGEMAVDGVGEMAVAITNPTHLF